MKIAIITDTHFGCRKNSQYFMDQQTVFYEEKFFPYIEENKIDTIFHLGDFFDNRKTVNFETLRHARSCFIDPIVDKGYKLHMLVGNHDSYYKSNGELTSTKLLFDEMENITIYDHLTIIDISGKSFLMVPWIFPIQKEKITNIIKLSPSDVVCGHFEMMGVPFQGDVVSNKGISTDIFSQFSHVFSGHFHKKSQYYVGSPYQMTWTDFNDPKRIIIYDTDTNETEDIYLAEDIYYKIEYPIVETSPPIWSQYKDKIVRVVVKSKDDPSHFDNFIDKLESEEPYDIDIKEEYLYVDIINSDELDEEADTLGILLNSIDEISEYNADDKFMIKKIIKLLYEKATK